MLHIAPSDVRLSAYMSKVDDFLAQARALKADLLGRLAQVDKTIEAFERMKREVPAEDLEKILTRSAAQVASGKLPTEEVEAPLKATEARAATPAEVVSLSQSTLLSAGRPMKRGALVKALRDRGAVLAGRDANKNLGTILWRHPRIFISVEGLGYWVKGVPLEGIYDPQRDDEPLPKTTFVPKRSA